MEGDQATSVPPRIFNFVFTGVKAAGSTMDWRRRVMEPAVPMSMNTSPPVYDPGVNSKDSEPAKFPETFALHKRCKALMLCRCWAFNPGTGRFLRMLVTSKGLPVKTLRPKACRTIAPHPSSLL